LAGTDTAWLVAGTGQLAWRCCSYQTVAAKLRLQNLDKVARSAVTTRWTETPKQLRGSDLRATSAGFPPGEDGMDFEKDHFEEDNELSRLEEDEELAGEGDEIVEVEEEEIVIGEEEPAAKPVAAKAKAAPKPATKPAKKAAKKPAKKAKAKPKKKAKKAAKKAKPAKKKKRR
jgi:hypothetical protein